MIIFIFLIIMLSFFEIKKMWGDKNKKGIGVYIGLAIIATSLGLFYSLNPYRNSFSYNVLRLLGINF